MSKPSVFRPSVEPLEHRNLPSASVTAHLIGSTLQVDGSAGNDYLRVDQSAGKISVYGTTITDGTARLGAVDAGRVARVVINAGAGNDIVVASSLTRDTEIYGGAGNDQIWGGAGNDFIDGGAGNDAIYAGAGNDRLKGGDSASEHDILSGGAGFNSYYHPFNPTAPIVNGAVDSDIKQGGAPLCQTLAAIAEAAKQGHNFAGDIHYLGGTSYQVKLTGLPAQTVNYDGWTTDNDPVPTDGEFWTILMQRARLQALGIDPNKEYTRPQWDALNQKLGGRLYSISEALYNFTGKTSTSADISAVTAQALQASLAHGDAIVAASKPTSGYVSANGIIGNHAYAVLGVYQDAGVWKVRLYNPWGTDRNNGGTIDALDKTRPAANDGFITLTWQQFTSSNNFKTIFTARA